MALYDPTPRETIVSPEFSVAEFLAWARTKPADQPYGVTVPDHCALGQFGQATGRPCLAEYYDPDQCLSTFGLNDALGFSGGSLTFGALAKRLEALS